MALADPIITPADAKDFLKITSNDQDSQVTQAIASASQMIVNRIGPVSGSPARDEWHDGGSDRIVLRNEGPVLSVSSVKESFGSIVYTLTQVDLDSGGSGDAYTYTVDLNEGLIVRRAAGVAIPFAAGVRNIHISYVAGYAADSIPEDIKQACRLMVKHLWNPRLGPRQSTNQPTASAKPGELPAEVEEALSTYLGGGVPGIA